MQEAGVILDFDYEPLFWHVPHDRSVGALPDSRNLWDIFWDNRQRVLGFAHSHPGYGVPAPSMTDLTTFAAVEAGLGVRLSWWIISGAAAICCKYEGPDKLDYRTYRVGYNSPWVRRLREFSNYDMPDPIRG